MKKVLNKVEGMNFKWAFAIFFAALAVFGIVAMIAGAADAGMWLERLTLTRLRTGMFSTIEDTIRFFSYMFLAGFHVLLALWVHADSKKRASKKKGLVVLTLITGLIGYLVYMIKRTDGAVAGGK